jgi:LacI family transcriptional regulator
MSTTYSNGDVTDVRAQRARVTLQMIARQLAVSTATVSLALRDSPLVAETTRRKVKKAARDLGYVYNRSAAALRMARTNILAVALHNILNPYFAEILAAIEQRAIEQGRTVMFGSCAGDTERQERVLTTLREYRPDGLLFCPTAGTRAENLDHLIASGIPVVQIVREIEDTGFDFVGLDDEAAAMMAIDHLMGLGHRRIAMLGGSMSVSTGRSRFAGYTKALRAAGVEIDSSLHVQGAETRDAGISGVHWLMDRRDRPTAIFCYNDLTALGAMVGMKQHGLEPGRDVSIIGCDDIAEAGASYPGLTTVRGNHIEMVHKAVDLLNDRMVDPGAQQKRLMVTPQLVVRGTTARAAA